MINNKHNKKQKKKKKKNMHHTQFIPYTFFPPVLFTQTDFFWDLPCSVTVISSIEKANNSEEAQGHTHWPIITVIIYIQLLHAHHALIDANCHTCGGSMQRTAWLEAPELEIFDYFSYFCNLMTVLSFSIVAFLVELHVEGKLLKRKIQS